MKTKTILTLCMALCSISPAIVAQNKNDGSRFLDNIYKSSQNQRNNNSSSQLEQMFKDAYKRVEKKKKLESEKQKQIEREQSFKKEVANSDDSFLDADPGQDKSAESNKKDITAQKNAVAKKEKDDISLVVSGEGSNKTEATKNALRSAIEQAYGTFVSASTEILNDELVKDEIATVASGNIKSYKELSTMTLPNGNTSVSLSAIVSIGKLVQYAQSHGGSAEFAGQAFLMNMRMRELNKQNEAIAIKNLYDKLLQLKPVLYDCTLDVGDPRKTVLYQYFHEHGGSTGSTPIGSGYCVPLRIDLTPTDNLINWLRELESTLSNLSLGEEEVESLERNGIHTYRYRFFNKVYSLRNNYASLDTDCAKILNAWSDAWIIKLNTGAEFYSVPENQLRDGQYYAVVPPYSYRLSPTVLYIDTYDFVFMSPNWASSLKTNDVAVNEKEMYTNGFDPHRLWDDYPCLSLNDDYLKPLKDFSPFERWHVYYTFELFFPEKKLERITSFSVDWIYQK